MVERTLTNEEQLVWDQIRKRVGKASAIPRELLGQVTGLNDRLVRIIIRILRLEFGKLICHLNDKPGGYFLAASVEELKMCRDTEGKRVAHVGENFNFYREAHEAAKDPQNNLSFTLAEE